MPGIVPLISTNLIIKFKLAGQKIGRSLSIQNPRLTSNQPYCCENATTHYNPKTYPARGKPVK
jgi:hypothetical protein